MTEEQIREEIARIVKKAVGRTSPDESYFKPISIKEATAQILSIKGIRIEAENQELPFPESIEFELNPNYCRDVLMVSPMGIALKDNLIKAYKQARQDMLKEGWVKCEKEG